MAKKPAARVKPPAASAAKAGAKAASAKKTEKPRVATTKPAVETKKAVAVKPEASGKKLAAAKVTKASKATNAKASAGTKTKNAATPAAKRRAARSSVTTTGTATTAEKSIATLLSEALASLKRHSSKAVRDGMVRFNIPNTNALGVKMGDIQQVGKQLGRHHELAEALWQTGIYEARMLTAYVAEPARVTPTQMDRWCREFDNWAVCDTLCFALFDRTPHAWKKAEQWAKKKSEYEKRAGLALFWCLSVHDKTAPDTAFLKGLNMIEAAATDDRHFVKKAANMALRAIGKRNKALNAAAITVATRLAASQDVTARWIGKDALREIAGAAVKERLKK